MVSETVTDDIQRNIDRSILHNYAKATPQHPAYGTAMIQQLIGELEAVIDKKHSDALLQSCDIQDAMPRIKGILRKIDTWSKQVSQMGPDDVPVIGADSCL